MTAPNQRRPDAPPLYTIEPVVWPADDEYSDPAVYKAGERMWWHSAVVRELQRLRDLRSEKCPNGLAAYSVAGIAGNLGMSQYDVAKYCRHMVTWGELVKAEALWDFEPDMWVALAPETP